MGTTIFSGISFTLGDVADDVGLGTLVTLNALNSDMFFTLAVGTSAFLAGLGVSIVQTEALPKWLGWVALVMGVIAITPLGFFAFLVMLLLADRTERAPLQDAGAYARSSGAIVRPVPLSCSQ